MRRGALSLAIATSVALNGLARAQPQPPTTAPTPQGPTQTAPSTPGAPSTPSPPSSVQPTPAQKPPAQTPPSQTTAAQPTVAQKYRNKEGELRISQLMGASVSNDQNQAIGTISDVLLGQDHKAVKAVLSVGGFLGVGSRLVEVPFGDLQIDPDKIVLPGATKVSLENLSAYQSP